MTMPDTALGGLYRAIDALGRWALSVVIGREAARSPVFVRTRIRLVLTLVTGAIVAGTALVLPWPLAWQSTSTTAIRVLLGFMIGALLGSTVVATALLGLARRARQDDRAGARLETVPDQRGKRFQRYADELTSVGLGIAVAAFFWFLRGSTAIWPVPGTGLHLTTMGVALLLIGAVAPSVFSLVNHFVGTTQGFATRRTTVEHYLTFLDRYMRDRAGSGYIFNPWGELILDDLDEYAPRFTYTFYGALLLAGSFVGAIYLAVLHDWGNLATSPLFIHALSAGAWASAGAFVYVCLSVIHRINASAMTGKFLVNTALRVLVVQLLGAVAGAINLFQPLGQGGIAIVFFLLGWFPAWAFDAVRQKAREVFHTEAQAEDLPVMLIDGIDHAVSDRLGEIGIWNIQHLATTDPGELTLRSLYPLYRVLDWIDQAIFILYVGPHVTKFRELGIRGVLDFSGYVAEQKDGNAWNELALKTGMPKEALQAIARILDGDFAAGLIRTIWQHEAVFSDDALATVMRSIGESYRAAITRKPPEPTTPPAEATPSSEPTPPEPTRPLRPDDVAPFRPIEPPLKNWTRDQLVCFQDALYSLLLQRLRMEWKGTVEDFVHLQDWRSVADVVIAKLRRASPKDPRLHTSAIEQAAQQEKTYKENVTAQG